MSGLVAPFEACPLEEAGIRGMDSQTRTKLNENGLRTVGDLLSFLPRDYACFRQGLSINQAPLEENLHIQGRVLQKALGRTRTGLDTVEILVDDGGGTLRAVWFNQAWVESQIQKGQTVSLFGKIRFEKLGRTMNNPKLAVVEETSATKARIEPIYREVGGIRSYQLQRWILALAQRLPEDTCPAPGLPSRKLAFAALHSPAAEEELALIRERQHPGLKRLIFDEFLGFQLEVVRREAKRKQRPYTRIAAPAALLDPFIARLPFSLTESQVEVIEALRVTLAEGGRLHALIQGDVGCGKTVVGLALAYLFAQATFQTVLLCPTTLLASQHAETARKLLEPLGLTVVLLTSGQSVGELREGLKQLASGAAHLAIGTHRLLQEDVVLAKLGLVLVDEQHRFGVEQRTALLKKGRFPHYCAFSATPIPRSLAMTVHADFEVHQIRQKPLNRAPVQTILKKASNRDEILEFVRTRTALGEGVFWVFPLIDEVAEEQERQFRSAEATARHFRELGFDSVGLVHGRMAKDEVQAQMAAFAAGQVAILVATTVIEVGVDIPHASVMVIEGADRFGLSQLHQLRGRVGRGGREGFCFLVASDGLTKSGLARLKVLHAHENGFDIAAFDLAQRGAGDLLGKQQSGFKGFQLGDPWLDRELMVAARNTALAQFMYKKTKGETLC